MKEKTIEQKLTEKEKTVLFVKSKGYNDMLRIIKGKNIRHTSTNGIFHFDWISLIIGIAAGIVFGIIIFYN